MDNHLFLSVFSNFQDIDSLPALQSWKYHAAEHCSLITMHESPLKIRQLNKFNGRCLYVFHYFADKPIKAPSDLLIGIIEKSMAK